MIMPDTFKPEPTRSIFDGNAPFLLPEGQEAAYLIGLWRGYRDAWQDVEVGKTLTELQDEEDRIYGEIVDSGLVYFVPPLPGAPARTARLMPDS
jgi:hypothetical protein